MTHIFPLIHAAVTAYLPQLTDTDDRKATQQYLHDIEVLLASIPTPITAPTNVIDFKPRPKATKAHKRTVTEDLIAILECKSDGFGGFEYGDID